MSSWGWAFPYSSSLQSTRLPALGTSCIGCSETSRGEEEARTEIQGTLPRESPLPERSKIPECR